MSTCETTRKSSHENPEQARGVFMTDDEGRSLKGHPHITFALEDEGVRQRRKPANGGGGAISNCCFHPSRSADVLARLGSC